MYELPEFKMLKLKSPKILFFKSSVFRKKRIFTGIAIIIISSFFGFLAGAVSGSYFYLYTRDYFSEDKIVLSQIIEKETVIEKEYIPQTSQEEKIIKVVEEVSPSVVSITVSKEVFFQKTRAGSGTGFIISSDGMILTNKHVVLDKEAEYTVLTNDGESFPAKVLARDPIKDLAIIKIENGNNFEPLKLGDSNNLQIGQTVIAIGNALGEFQNTVSVGVVSGLKRTVTASGGGITEVLENLIQSDAAINKGNSGGPLLNLRGEVIGVNVAMSQVAENIGFAIPINEAKRDIEQVKTLGKIVYPFLGVRYIPVSEDYGVLIVRGDGPKELAITPGSAADKAGLREDDIILEFNNEKITLENSLGKIIQEYQPGDKIVLKILRPARNAGGKDKEKIVSVILGERSE
ncbi:trypsin-like peptidase domain-containing protein [Candidatus Parcubacteria bacterium]|nr:trypsin-like peptidase domain-containing protein [Candidatus Parcubacteria bacterium]